MRADRNFHDIGKGSVFRVLRRYYIAALNSLIAALLSLFPAPAAAQSSSYEADRAVYQACLDANTKLGANQFAAARDILIAAEKLPSTSYAGYLHRHLAFAYRGLKQYRQAIDELNISSRYEANKRLKYDIAMINYEAGNLDEAVSQLEQYLKEGPDEETRKSARSLLKQVGAYANLNSAARLIKAGKLKEARPILARAATFDPSPYSDSIHSNLAYVLRNTGQPELAIEEGLKALALDPNEATTYYTLGLAYQDTGDFDKAISWLRKYAEHETNAGERRQALDFAQELADDRAKQKPGATKAPDYMAEQRDTDHMSTWPAANMPLKVYLKPAKGVRGYKSEFNSYITNAFDTWCSVCHKISYKLVSSPKDADIRVIWTTEQQTLEENGRVRQKAALTYVNSDKGDILSARITVRTLNSFNNDAPVENGECASTAMHEVGHSLGLAHSPNVADIMYFGSSSKQKGVPSDRDKRTLNCLYQNLPALAFVTRAQPLVVEYLPPPAFLPPRPVDTSDLRPPVFLPPPLPKDAEKLNPPIFVPPPLSQKQIPKNSQPALPFFVPPPKK